MMAFEFFFTSAFSLPGVSSGEYSSKGSRSGQPDLYSEHPKAAFPFSKCPLPHTGQTICSSFLTAGLRGAFGLVSAADPPGGYTRA